MKEEAKDGNVQVIARLVDGEPPEPLNHIYWSIIGAARAATPPRLWVTSFVRVTFWFTASQRASRQSHAYHSTALVNINKFI